MKNILITGGTGYIGSHIAVELLTTGIQVILVDDFSNSSSDVAIKIKEITQINPYLYECDVMDYNKLSTIFSNHQIDGVIHCSGYKAVGESVKFPLKYYHNNLNGTINLLDVMLQYGVNNVVFSSSATVYGAPSQLPLYEDMPTGKCSNPYGTTKLFSEQIITDVVNANPKLSAVILRYFNPVGAHKSALIGERPNAIPSNLMPYIAQTSSGKFDKLKIFGNDYPTKDGTGVRDYIHVVDLAKGHLKAIEYCKNHKGIEIFNLGTGIGHSVLEMVNAFERVNSVNVPYEITSRRDGDIAMCYAHVGKAKKLLNWWAQLTLDDMCRDAWRFEKKLL